jgi:hypothetical protein
MILKIQINLFKQRLIMEKSEGDKLVKNSTKKERLHERPR